MEKVVEVCEADSTTLIIGKRVSVLPCFENGINNENNKNHENHENNIMNTHNSNVNGVSVSDNNKESENAIEEENEIENVCDVENEENPNRKLCQIPLARVKKIMKSDPDTINISNEALFLITRATEAFINLFSSEVHEALIKGRGRTLKIEYLKQVIESQENFMFLDGVFD